MALLRLLLTVGLTHSLLHSTQRRRPTRRAAEQTGNEKKRRWTAPSKRKPAAAADDAAPTGAKRWSKPAGAPPADAAADLARESGAVARGEICSDPRAAVVALPRGATGVEWGTDLSFKGVYVRALDPGGAAEQSGVVAVGDQLVAVDGATAYEATFDQVIAAMGAAGERRLEFFRGTRPELLEALGRAVANTATTALITVRDQGRTRELRVPLGANLRDALVADGIDVYRGTTAWTNCAGHQMCGTCIVDVTEGSADTNRKSNDEEGTLNLQGCAATCRLSCVTFVYGDIDVVVRPDRDGGFFGSATSGSAW